MDENRKLRRSHNKIIAGVCAGFAEYFSVDVTLVRIIWVLLSLSGGTGLILYIACILLMPTE